MMLCRIKKSECFISSLHTNHTVMHQLNNCFYCGKTEGEEEEDEDGEEEDFDEEDDDEEDEEEVEGEEDDEVSGEDEVRDGDIIKQ